MKSAALANHEQFASGGVTMEKLGVLPVRRTSGKALYSPELLRVIAYPFLQRLGGGPPLDLDRFDWTGGCREACYGVDYVAA